LVSQENHPLNNRILRSIGFWFVNLLALLAFVIALFLAWWRYTNHPIHFFTLSNPKTEKPTLIPTSTLPTSSDVSLPDVSFEPTRSHLGIPRLAMVMTTIPARPHTDIITYTVQTGDTLFSIAEQFKIQPATLLWGNFDTLEDNPHLLKPGQVLNVLPIDGTYYQWKEGDSIESIASFFKTKQENILEFTGNGIDLTALNQQNSGIKPGQWIIIPGGKRAIKDWGPPAISRTNPASARTYGPGYCGQVYEGAVGTQSFIWPTVDRGISGYNYDPGVHPGIDITGQVGNAVFASDSGVVVYAGWSNYGYGYLIVIDHGYGWQTAYAHLSAVGVSCGQSVFRGGVIGAVGSTGNSTGAHLHFEMVLNGVKVNPLDYLH
jgi:murein DD-endopeptidase MepM/ murein hydrolase activator NlpD